MAIYQAGECNDPLYLCAGHYAEGRYAAANASEVRTVVSPRRSSSVAEVAPQEAAVSIAPTPEHVYRPLAMPLADRPRPVAVPGTEVTTGRAAADAPRPPLGTTLAPEIVAAKSSIAAAPSPQVPSKPTLARAGRSAGTRTNAPRDVTYGDSAKALVDEAIWNLPAGDYEAFASALRLGKSPLEAAQAAGGQMAFIHRKISDYTFKLAMVLSESGAKICSAEVIEKPFEQAMLEIIECDMPDNEKDKALARLGSLQQAINGGVGGEMTPLQAHGIALAIGDRAGWGSAPLPDELKPVYRAVYLGLREAVRAAAPLATSLDERLTNLYAAKAELEAAASSGQQRLTA